MIVLGMDTSGYANAVGVADGDKVLADFNFEARTDSLEKIVANIDFALRSAGLTLEDIGGIGVGLGPGSWTGIRVGVTAGKILAYSTGRPVGGVPTLEAMAYAARHEAPFICPIISMGTGDAVYAAFYDAADGEVTRAGDYYVGGVAGLAGMIEKPALVVGRGAEKYAGIIREVSPGLKGNIRAREALPGGAAVASLAARRLEAGDSDDALSLTPLYLKESTARAFVNRYSGKGG